MYQILEASSTEKLGGKVNHALRTGAILVGSPSVALSPETTEDIKRKSYIQAVMYTVPADTNTIIEK